jgi:hypothetical protein
MICGMAQPPVPPVRAAEPLPAPDGAQDAAGSALEPFYLPRGEGRFHATHSTTGPWFADAQHAGPPSALLVRALERCASVPDPQFSRVTFEILGPVPAGDVEVVAQVDRAGRAIELSTAVLHAGGRAVMRATAWRVAPGDTAVAAVGAAPPLPPPSEARERAERPDGWLPGYVDALAWRWIHGWLGEPGPGAVWGRLRVPVVAGEEPTPLQRLAALADSANGAGAPLDIRSWLFVNTDLTLHLHRMPVGEWMAVDAGTVVGPTGMGTAAAALHDERGHLGRCAQALIVRPR